MKVISLSLSIIQADNRVIRQCDAFVHAGYKVVAFGLQGKDIRQKNFAFEIRPVTELAITPATSSEAIIDHEPLPLSTFQRFKGNVRSFLESRGYRTIFQILKKLYSLFKIMVLFSFRLKSLSRYLRCTLQLRGSWEVIYWKAPIFNAFIREIEKENLGDVALVIANDWQMLPIAKFLADKYNLKYSYDSHEHALSENNHSFIHKYLLNGYISLLEKECLEGASFVTSVSEGIVTAIKKQYQLSCPHFVVRSTPYYKKIPFRPTTNDKIIIYFHGYLKENRNLDVIVKCLVFLKDQYHVLFRGGHYSSVDYEKSLKSLAKELGVDKRFSIEPIASHDQMIELTSQADIGLSLPPLNSLHSDMALPNKFFEYMMAGLAIGVSNVKEMGDYVRHFNLGFVLQDISPAALAKAIESLSVEQINQARKNSLKLAEDLHWEKERDSYIEKFNKAVDL